MLQAIAVRTLAGKVFRLSAVFLDRRIQHILEGAEGRAKYGREFLRAVNPTKKYIKNFNQPENLEEIYLDSIFKPKKMIKKELRDNSSHGRFSDGTFPVLYSSLEKETAIEEVRYWHRRLFCTREERRRKIYRILFSCEFSGSVKDLHLLTCPNACSDCPNISPDTPPPTCKKLVHGNKASSSGYQYCRNLGASAKNEGLDGLLAPSARRRDGKNLPVFSRKALSHLCNVEYCYTVYDPKADSIRFMPIDLPSPD